MDTDSITLRPLAQTDVPDVFLLASDPEVAQFMRFDTHTRLSQTQALVNGYLQQNAFAVLLGGSFAGVFVLKAEKPRAYSLSLFLGKPFWNKGVASTVLAKMVRYAAENLKAEELSAYVVAENCGSRRVLEKNGFFVAETLEFADFHSRLFVYRLFL